MSEAAAPNDTSAELDALIETNGEILEQIRKELSQEYTRFMGRLLRERLRDGSGTVLDHVKKTAPVSSKSGGA